MKTASIQELKQELQSLPPAKLLELCLRLARFKKENKELLGFLLFESHDEEGYLQGINQMIDEEFAGISNTTTYLLKKSLRKILRMANKYIRYAGSKQVEAAVLIHYCRQWKQSGLPMDKAPVLINLYQQQLKKIAAAIATLHEDLQYDYQRELEALKPPAEKQGSFLRIFRKKGSD
jgi:hypothetical protein